MAFNFSTNVVSIADEDDVLAVTFATQSAEPDDVYLMFQRNESTTAEDHAFGMDQPYVEFAGQSWGWYGHMLSVSLERRRLEVKLNEEAAQRMKSDGSIVVDFDIAQDKFDDLASALAQVFQGCAYYSAPAPHATAER